MNIKELADQAGLDWQRGWTLDDNEPNRFSVFAKLVAAHEREAILELVDSYAKNNTDLTDAIKARNKA